MFGKITHQLDQFKYFQILWTVILITFTEKGCNKVFPIYNMFNKPFTITVT